MKKKIVKGILLVLGIALVIITILNIYNWISRGKQEITISTARKAYSNNDLYVSISAQKNGEDLETRTKVKLLNSKGRKVKNTKVSYDGSNCVIAVPKVESGNYFLEAKVSSKKGKDTIQKQIYITEEGSENITITLEKGIYKPGDVVNFRALLTEKVEDKPVEKEVSVCIYDGNDNKVYNEKVKTSEYGILSGTFKLANEVNSGIYKLVVTTNNVETVKNFKVNPYITPKYEVKINFDKENYLVGDTAKINLVAKYFFGEPVANAKYKVFINDKEEPTITADEKGNAEISYKIEYAKAYTVKVEAVDDSNYFVEASNKFVASSDIFEVELLPEYGKLVNKRVNDIYVFTKKADGTPVKTYVTIYSDNNTKQIATDENGIGKFSIDVDNREYNNKYTQNNYTNSEYTGNNFNTGKNRNDEYVNNYKSNKYNSFEKVFRITATDMDGKEVRKTIHLPIENKNLLVFTNKAKYNQGEDIEIKMSSNFEDVKNIYLFKNDKLIKSITTDSEETNINLGNEYGLIDIFVTAKYHNSSIPIKSSNKQPMSSNSAKRTIFIKPAKALNIGITTDKEEYKPGENIKISFGTTDEQNNNIDTALLVSMLDNSILNLAENDLSIDNIKIALSSLKFSDELDAATLYTSIIDDTSEQTIMALLLKQEDHDLNVSEDKIVNHTGKEKAASIACCLIILIIASSLIYTLVKFPKFRRIMAHALNILIFLSIILSITSFIINEFSYDDFAWIGFILVGIIGLVSYIVWISKKSKKFTRTSISILATFVILHLFLTIISFFEMKKQLFLLILLIILVLLLILFLIMLKNKRKKLKRGSEIIEKIAEEFSYIFKFIFAVIISLVIAWLVYCTVDLIFEFYDVALLVLPVILVGTYFFNCLFNKIGGGIGVKKGEETKANLKNLENTEKIFVGIVISLIFLVIILFLSQATKPSRHSVNFNDEFDINMGFNSEIKGTVDELIPAKITTQSKRKSIFDISSIFEGDKESVAENISKQERKPSAEKITDTKIRNVFLESMCFIPELITSNGKADLDLQLSDNITTWTIQTVGNTKDGRVGYGKLDTVKVFKEFFVDFELPKNLVETDKISIPVTVYNYTENSIQTTLNIKEEEWFSLGRNNIRLNIEPKQTKMVYVPITINKFGEFKFRVEATSNNLTDIIEKSLTISPKGYKVEKVVSTGKLDKDISEDILLLEEFIAGTASAKVKIYASTMSQVVEGMENIFRMPTGCFEQVSSSLYPNILALKYLQNNKLIDKEIKEKALEYISSGYQKLLSYEVKGETGGYSLYGTKPAETVLTAYGLMQLTDLKEVYNVDASVIERMNKFLYDKQNVNGSFNLTGNHIGGANSKEKLALDAYITWALSESNPNENKLKKSVEYLKGKIDKADDNYTLALIANILANVEDKEVNRVTKRLINNINIEGDRGYIKSNITDYYGSRGRTQTIQTVALTSIALSKTSTSMNTNRLLIDYLISQKDKSGTWYSTQATILALKALNEAQEGGKLENQTISVKINDNEQKIEIKDNPLGIYELDFNNLVKENKLNIDIKKGNAYYEVIEQYYIPFEKIDMTKDNIEVNVDAITNLRVNEILQAKVDIINRGETEIYNGMVTISIPQGFTVVEESLAKLKSRGIIEKYETSYTSVNVYLRNFERSHRTVLDVGFRALYPVDITGLSVKVYDYYNPEVEGKTQPIQILVR